MKAVVEKFASIVCPHCWTEVYLWFVKKNGYCPRCRKSIEQ